MVKGMRVRMSVRVSMRVSVRGRVEGQGEGKVPEILTYCNIGTVSTIIDVLVF